jgi:hypothetical protein
MVFVLNHKKVIRQAKKIPDARPRAIDSVSILAK